MKLRIASVVCLLAGLWAVSLAGAMNDLAGVLTRMDESGAAFRSMSARIKRVSHTAVLNDTTTETGSVIMVRPKANDLRVRMEMTEPDTKSVAFVNNKAEIFYPKINTVQEYNLGKHKSLVDQYLMLGFGGSSKELQRSYSLRVLAEEEVQGRKTTRIEMTPKSADTREHLSKVEMWITEAGYPVQQKLYYPSGDYMLITYSDVKWNPALSADAVRLKLPSGVKREYPQR